MRCAALWGGRRAVSPQEASITLDVGHRSAVERAGHPVRTAVTFNSDDADVEFDDPATSIP